MKPFRIFGAVTMVAVGIVTIVGSASAPPQDKEREIWARNGFTVEDERLWKEHGFDSQDASSWKIKGYSADKARIEKDKQQAQRKAHLIEIAKSECRNGVIEYDSWKKPNLYSMETCRKVCWFAFRGQAIFIKK